MRKIIKKIVTISLALALVFAMNTAAFAAEAGNTVFCNFICAGQITGKTIPAGTNVVAPSVPVVGGFTFCGFDKSLKNITTNTTFTAVYVSDSLGKEAIEAKKASLPTPAISATTVANPNTAMPAVAAPTPMNANPTAAPAQTGVTTGVTTAANASATDMAKLLQLQQLIMAQQASAQKAPQAAPAPAQATQPQAAPAQANVVAAAPSAPAVVAGIPSWAVGLEGVDAAGAAKAYNYLKNTKGLDDATIQANWGAFMHHYAGHGVAGW